MDLKEQRDEAYTVIRRLQAERDELLAMLRRVVDAESVADYDQETDAAEALLVKYEAAGESDAK